MKTISNMGTWDRVLRIILAIVMLVMYFTNVLNGVVGGVLLALSVVFLLTSFVSFCPLYLPFNISTKPKKDKEEL